VAPAAIARPRTSVRREIIDSGSRRISRVITSSQCMCRPVDPAVRVKANPVRVRLREPLLIQLAGRVGRLFVVGEPRITLR